MWNNTHGGELKILNVGESSAGDQPLYIRELNRPIKNMGTLSSRITPLCTSKNWLRKENLLCEVQSLIQNQGLYRRKKFYENNGCESAFWFTLAASEKSQNKGMLISIWWVGKDLHLDWTTRWPSGTPMGEKRYRSKKCGQHPEDRNRCR